MRIAYVSYEYPPDSALGGIATYVQQAAQLMTERGHSVEVFASSPLREGSYTDGAVQLHLFNVPEREDFADAIAATFARRHSEAPFDLVEGPEYFADAAKICPVTRSIPLVVKMHTPSILLWEISGVKALSPSEDLRDRWARTRVWLGAVRRGEKPSTIRTAASYRRENLGLYRNERDHARSADLVACPCLDLTTFATERWGVDRANVRHVPYMYVPRPALLEVPIETNTGVVGFLGRLEHRKGVEFLADALPRILKEVPSARIRLIGRSQDLPGNKGPAHDYILKQAGAFADRVEITGPIPLNQIPEALKGLDVCVYPSIWENFPNVCLEAMAAGRGIVGSQAGGMAEMLSSGAGVLVPPKDSEAIARATIDLLTNREKRWALGATARKRLHDEYNGERIGALMEKIYREAIDIRRAKAAKL